MSNYLIIAKFLLIYIFCSDIYAQSPSNNNTEQIVKNHLIRAETWYWMARATNNSYEYHNYAENEYKYAMDKASNLPSKIKDKYFPFAEAGLEQTYWRKINAWNSFRNIFPAAWWHSWEDPTLDYQDEDHLMLALSLGWQGLEPGIIKPLTPKIFIIPRCIDSKKFEQSTDCGEIIDEFLNTLDINSRFLGVRNDAIAGAIGPEWQEFIKYGTPKPEHLEALGKFLFVEKIGIVDIYVVDEFEEPLVGGRIDIQFNEWDLKTMQIVNAGNDSGVVISLRDRRWMIPFWILSLLIISFIILYFNLDKNKSIKSYLAPYLIFFISGFLLSHFAGQFTSRFIPEWGSMALNTDHYLPLTEMWLWAFFHGAMIMVGPIILVAYFLIRFSDKLPYIGDLDLQKESSSILFTVQSGALGSLFSPIIMAWHNEGVIIALAMTASALILSLAISKPFSTLIGYSGDDKIQQNPGISFTSGVIGLLLIVPIGFFRPEWADYWPLCISIFISFITSFFIFKDLKIPSERESLKPIENEIGNRDGSIDNPIWTPNFNNDLDNSTNINKLEDIINEVDEPGLHTIIIGSDEGIGKTRLMVELRDLLDKHDTPWEIGLDSCEANSEGEPIEPFKVVSSVFGQVLNINSLASDQSNRAQLSEVFSGLEANLAELPGIGSLFETGEDEDHEIASKDQIIRDMTVAVSKRSEKYPLAFLIDDIHWADESSLELLNKLIKNLTKNKLKKSVVFILAGINAPPIEHYFDETNNINPFPRKIFILSSFDKNNINDFLKNTNLTNFPADFGQKIIEYIGSSKAGQNKGVTPSHTLTLLRGLINSKNAFTDDSGATKLNEGLTDEDMANAVPKEIDDQLKKRINQLVPEDIEYLEAAAQIGRVFSIGQLSAGLNIDSLKLLRSMRRIEEDFHLVIDQDKSDDLMSLESESLRRVLRDRAKNNGKNPHKIFKELHYKIANYMIENHIKYSPIQIMKHCIQSVERLGDQAIIYGLEACRSAEKKYAWSELLLIINRLRALEKDNSNLIDNSEPNIKNELYFLEAKALRGSGQSLEKADAILYEILQSKTNKDFNLYYTFFENRFSNGKLDYLSNKKGPIYQELSNSKNDRSISFYLGEFYAITSSTRIKFNTHRSEKVDNKKPIVTVLQIHEEHIDSLGKLKVKLDKESFDDADLPNKKKLLSFIVQELAIYTGGLYKERIMQDSSLKSSNLDNISELENLHKKTLELFDQSLLLKKETGDLFGQIINLGSRGNYLFTARNEYDKAFECYQEYLSLADKIGDDASKSSMNNKIAEYYYKKYSIDETKTDFLQKACDKAHESFIIALEIDNKLNLFFAFKNILEYASKLNNLKLIDKVGSELNQRDIFKEIPPFMNNMILNIISNFNNKWEKWDWAQNLKESLTKSER